LTRRRWMEYMMYGLAAIGVGLGALAYLHIWSNYFVATQLKLSFLDAAGCVTSSK
jgi:hypothetical protein